MQGLGIELESYVWLPVSQSPLSTLRPVFIIFCYSAYKEQIIIPLHFWEMKLASLTELDGFKGLLFLIAS